MGEAINSISIALIDDHPILRQGMVASFQTEPRLSVVAEGSSSIEALEIAKVHCPDIMILDLGIPGGGLEALKQITIEYPSVRCIILTVCDDPQTAIAAMKSGAQGYILKGVGARELKAAILTVYNNESFISPEFASKLVLAAQAGDGLKFDSGLSHRETQILTEVQNGATNKMVAVKLNISEKTVKHYMSSIMQKYGVANRVSAVMAYQASRPTRHV